MVVAEDSGVGFEDGLIIGRLHAAVLGKCPCLFVNSVEVFYTLIL